MRHSFDNSIVRVTRGGAFLLPLLISVLAASPEPYWLDSPEFTAAAQSLGIPHPPGHPLYVMLTKPFTLLPFGGIAFRVSIASAFFGALASLLLFETTFLVLKKTTEQVSVFIRAILSFCAAIMAASTPGWWFQCVRAEVYSLQILLVLGAFYPLVKYCVNSDERDGRFLYLSAFIFGLGLTNHHFIMLAVLPAAIVPIVAMAQKKGGFGAVKTGIKLAFASALGLLPYLFIPIRSVAEAPIALGAVYSFSDFWWVVTAKVYQKSMNKEHIIGLDERSINTVFSMMSELGPLIVVISLAGLYLLIRRKKTQILGIVIGLLGGVSIILRSIMGFDSFNPDYYGYMLPSVVAIVISAAVFASVFLAVIKRTFQTAKWISPVLVVALIALPIFKIKSSHAKVDLSRFRATRLFYDLSVEDAPTNSLVLTSYYKLFFVLWSAQFIDGSRPDITVINPQLFGYPGYLYQTLHKYPELRPLAWSMLRNGHITELAIANLSLNAPVGIEVSPWIEDAALSHILPNGPIYQAAPEPLGLSDIVAAAPLHFAKWKNFYKLLGDGWKEHETWRMLSWCHYIDGVYFAGRGDRKSALISINFAKTLGNIAPQITNLETAIKQSKSGPVDVSSFILDFKVE